MGSIKNIPKLRFPEFDGKWEKTALNKVAKIYDGTHQTPKYIKEGVPFVSVEDIENINDSNKYISNEAFEKNFKIKPQRDDILMTRITAGIIGATAIINNNKPLGYYVSLALIRKLPNIDVKYLNQSINSFLFKHELHKRIIHVAFPKKINLGDICNCKLSVPQIPEQQKIATFLTAVDDKIQQLTKKKALLEQYKKGVMQKIFKQEIRFKDDDGKEFLEWEEKKLGDIYSFISTNSFSREKLNFELGIYRNIHYGDIHTKFRSAFNIKKETVPFINPEVEITNSPENYCQSGDLIFADASEDYNDIGKCIEIVNTNSEIILAGLHTIHAKSNPKRMYIGFGGYLMQSEDIKRQIKIIAQGIKVLSISPKRLAEIMLILPCINEQQKIADFLTAIDNKIEQVNTQLDKTKAFKKGLLQQMFV